MIVSTSSLATAQQRSHSNISRGSSLTPTKTSSWMSKSGLYAFGFYQRGNGGYSIGVFVAGIPEKTVVWTARRDDPPVSSNATLLFTTADGKLVLQTGQCQDTYIADVSQTVSYASMLDTGNFVLYDSDGHIRWQSFEHPTDTLLPTQRLSAGMKLLSSLSETDQSTGLFGLYMQCDGNLVQYPKDSAVEEFAYWESDTNNLLLDNGTLTLGIDGNLYLVDTTGSNVKNLTSGGYATRGTIFMMKIDWDGLLRLYSHDLSHSSRWLIVWSSTEDRCAPRGLCGFNSFCIANDQEPECKCIPGFTPVNQGNWTSGCERNFTAESSKNKGKKYSLQTEYNTIWEDVSYSVLSQTSKDDCSQACLVDSNCEAAIFKDGDCKKQGLPLRYGRRSFHIDESINIAFIKVEESPESSTRRSFPTREGKKGISSNIIIIIIISSLFLSSIIIIVAIFGVVNYRYCVLSHRRNPRNGNIEFCQDIAARSYSYAELERMTDGFKEEIGRGSSGTVYNGMMTNADENYVAAKRLHNLSFTSEREFWKEIKVIGRAHPRNLLRLHGYSIDGPNKVLVYEYISNGSLADVLFTPEKQMNWNERMGIARDIARDQTKTFTGIRGTRGYVAPEWHRKLPVTVKADVYSFGIVLLEIICYRKNLYQSLPENQVILEEWVYQCFEGGE
ncbi:hypothetical protein Dsin_016276 [Dipteronia sinensis]|uniref:Receptor-like serine/threonine-protein kinase n=1 Tax=Dipteronia sinensis TaxID=43782 RepID=A0AAE0AE68_9ROSI|nr:hypothetical protein Dsin_016276 [Dipteronia sinensis]